MELFIAIAMLCQTPTGATYTLKDVKQFQKECHKKLLECIKKKTKPDSPNTVYVGPKQLDACVVEGDY